MKVNYTLISIVSVLILSILQYFDYPAYSSYYTPLMFVFTSISIQWIFYSNEYENRNFYIFIPILSLFSMWIVIISNPLSISANKTILYIESGLLTILNIVLSMIIIRELNKVKDILTFYDKKLEANPTDIVTLNNKGVELANKWKFKTAAKCFDRVLEIDPDDAAALHNKGVILQKNGNTIKGKKCIDKALELDPKLKNTKNSGKNILKSITPRNILKVSKK